MSESLNFLLLSTFYQIERVEQDMQTLLKRCQALLIIYTNLAILTAMAIRNLYFLIGLSVPGNDVNLTLVGIPILSLICLKRKNLTLAVSLVLILCHVAVYQVCQADETSLCSLTLAQGVSAFVFFLTPRPIFHILNLVLCLIQNVFIVKRISGIFGTTFTEEQSLNIVQNNLASFLYIMIFASVSYTQRSIQENLLQIIQSHSHRTEKISQELIQALKAKDMFVNSLSHEIRNPLNAMKGSIDYLLKTVKSSTQLQVLENASLSSEVLLQLLNNVLDAAKLRSDKMELLYSETNLSNIVKKVMTTQSDRIKEKDMIAEIYIDRKIPKKLWIDSSRLMQVLMNLVSNAVKFTPKKGKLSIYASWYSANENKEKLLAVFIRSKKKQVPDQEQTDDDKVTQGYSASLRKLSNRKTLTLSDSTMSLAPFEYSVEATSAPFNKMQDRNFSPKPTKIIEPKSKIELENPTDNNSPHREFASPATAQTNNLFSPDLIPEDPKNKGYLKIQISDNGPGIAEDVLPNLFTMFSQSNKEAASIYGGSGLGLWICKQLCEKMGGDIAIHSQVNKGTSLVFYVPIDNSNIQFANSLSFKSPNIIKKKDVRALVVDDYAYNRDIHKLLLEREGVRVSMACHGKEALEKYIMDGEGYYDFILMDIQMPEMDGFTAFRKIREWEVNKNWKKVQVYFVSGNYYNEQELLAELKSHGQMDDYGEVKCLRKPIDVAAITNIVDQFSGIA